MRFDAGSIVSHGSRTPDASGLTSGDVGHARDDDVDKRRRTLQRVERVTRLMDQNWRIPGTKLRFGLDPIIGLLPGVGDATTLLISLYPVVEAWQLGLPRHLLVRMIANVGIDGVVGAIPLLGDVFDFAFKANRRNLRLLKRHLHKG